MTIPVSEGALPLFLFLGQSYFGKNSNNGRVLRPPELNSARMLDGAHKLFGAGHMPIASRFTGLAPAADFMPRVQSPVTAFLYRYQHLAGAAGLPSASIGHADSRSNASIEHLLPASHPAHKTSSVFENLMHAVTAARGFARSEGREVFVPALFFCQGTGDRTMDGQVYLNKLNMLFDVLGSEICARTGQSTPPHFFIVQPPAKVSGGRWPCLQAHLDICAGRDDCTLAMAGWAIPQHDRTHFTGAGCVAVGEICAEVYMAALQGEDMSAPYIGGLRRNGNTITADISGATGIVCDPGPDTPRHRVKGAPLKHHGLQLDRGTISSVAVNNRTIRIALAPGSEPPQTLHFAHATRESLGLKGLQDKANQSTNRGNIRADRRIESLFLDTPLYQWMASSVHSIPL